MRISEELRRIKDSVQVHEKSKITKLNFLIKSNCIFPPQNDSSKIHPTITFPLWGNGAKHCTHCVDQLRNMCCDSLTCNMMNSIPATGTVHPAGLGRDCLSLVACPAWTRPTERQQLHINMSCLDHRRCWRREEKEDGEREKEKRESSK